MALRQMVDIPSHRRGAGAIPFLPRRAAFWAVAFAFLAVTAFSTAPSSLYGVIQEREGIAPLTTTIVYAVYAAGVVMSLLLVGHVSDWYGRRSVLAPALALALVAAVVFLVWDSLAGLLVGRVLTGIAVGAAVATATAYIADLDADATGAPSRRAGIVATIANIGGLGVGPLVAGVLAAGASSSLTVPFAVFLATLVLALALVLVSPEGHAPVRPRPRYRPQRLKAPQHGRRRFAAAVTGGFVAFAIGGLFAGLAGMFLAGATQDPSPALVGLTIFLTFGAGVLVQTTTTGWPVHRLVAAGIAPLLAGLALLALSAWTSPPSLALFIIAGVIAGSGVGALLRGSLTIVIAASGGDDRAGALATFFTAAYTGVSLPVVGLGVALQHLSPRVALLLFVLAAGIGTLAAAPLLLSPNPPRRTTKGPER